MMGDLNNSPLNKEMVEKPVLIFSAIRFNHALAHNKIDNIKQKDATNYIIIYFKYNGVPIPE